MKRTSWLINWRNFKPWSRTQLRSGRIFALEWLNIISLKWQKTQPTSPIVQWSDILLVDLPSCRISKVGLEKSLTGNVDGQSTTQYLGKNFFLIEFADHVDRDVAIDYAPWFYGIKFLYIFPCIPNFDLSTRHYYMLQVWVAFPFCSIVLESTKFKMACSLSEVLLYVRGEERSSYPNDKACILWDLREAIPYSIQVKISKQISIWQPMV